MSLEVSNACHVQRESYDRFLAKLEYVAWRLGARYDRERGTAAIVKAAVGDIALLLSMGPLSRSRRLNDPTFIPTRTSQDPLADP